MWKYEKRLQFPVNIKEPNAKMAQFIMSQYGGPDGEMGASMRYLSQRYAMPYKECKGALTDIGTEELGHLEIVAAIIHQLTRGLSAQELADQGFGPYYIDHTTGIWPQAAGGVPFNACEFQSKGDVIQNKRPVLPTTTFFVLSGITMYASLFVFLGNVSWSITKDSANFSASRRKSWTAAISMPLIRPLIPPP